MFEKIKAVFKLMRWFHELVVVIPFIGLFLIIDFYSKTNNLNCVLSAVDFGILCFCVQALIAAGCVLNDIADVNIDKINKPKTHIIGNSISLKEAKALFILLSLIILVSSIYISLYVFSEWAYISCGVYALSFVYDFYLKRSPLFGNVLMAVLTSFIPLVLFFYAKDCIEALQSQRISVLIYLYAALPFLIIIPRELSLDISDMEGDKACGCRTLPIIIGEKKSKQIVILFLFLIIVLSIPTAIKFQYLAFSLVLIDVLLLIYIYKLKSVKTRLEYIRIGRFLWFVMILGLVLFTISTIYF